MAQDTGGEKSLPASQYKIQKAREEGNVAKSQDLTAGWSLMMALAGVWYLGPAVFESLLDATHYYFSNLSNFDLTPSTFANFSVVSIWLTAKAAAPLVLLLLVAGVTMNVIQVGFLYAPKSIVPKLSRVNPISGFQRFFSARTAAELVKSILKLVLVSVVVYWALRNRWDDVLLASYLTPLGASIVMTELVLVVWFRVVLAMLVLGILDYGFQRWQYGRDLMMTVQEAKEEAKQFEGDPRIKQRVRQIQRQMAMKRMMSEVPAADVIITNPVRFAVALRYDPSNMQAPVVVAKGARLLAKRIREIAEEHGVPIVEKPELARALFKNIEVGHSVPDNLFRAVAEVLAFVYKIDQRHEKIQERAAFGGAPHLAVAGN
ncbi:MAG: flagellar biosynthesis protein FlhB [Candidatus Hydrogenedentes bacterium]|nr:flagellar biosynthesis protein FlhB [Candidatus Hydrogenedentota bacterium]